MIATTDTPVTITSHKVQALAQAEWFAFAGNPYYGYLTATPSVYLVEVKRTRNGEFYVSTCYDPAVQQVHAFAPGYRSNAFATEEEARQDANRVWLYLRDAFVMDFGASALTTVAVDHKGLKRGRTWIGESFGATCPLPDGTPSYNRETLCPTCQHFGTLTTRMESYGDATSCSTEGCTYSTYHSIGD